jgi:hypothetical protein
MSNTRVRAADGIMTTVYVTCSRPAVGLGTARRERDRVVRQEAFSTRRNFLATHIRQRLAFRALPRRRRPLAIGVISSALVASLVLGIGEPPLARLLELAAGLAAVTLSPVVMLADMELHRASTAAQLEDNKPVHPSQRDENWTAASGATTVPAYWLSIRRLYMRVQAPTWALLRFTRRPDLQERLAPRDFSDPD